MVALISLTGPVGQPQIRQDDLVLIAYLDESYNKDRYYIAAFVIDENDLSQLEMAVEDAAAYAEGFGVPAGTELHAHKIMSGTSGWEAIRGKHRAAIAIYQRALSNIAGLPGLMYIRGVDVVRLNARYRYPYPPHQIALQYVLEELSDFGARKCQQVLVIADQIADQEAHKSQVLGYQLLGTPGYKPNMLANIEKPIQFQESHLSAGLQIADLIAYLYRRFDGHVETDPRARASVEKMWQTLQPIWGSVWVWTP